ncbi:hypothetical protein B0H12DRAFT_1328092 [Mycena haematopus]|nr:hypothetical protein B0H12DRAFT_1328092 [Mycena haematopus]
MPGAALPPTSSLSHTQRIRLLRSTRKIESILGEAPLLASTNDPSFPPLRKISTSDFTAGSRSRSSRTSRPVLMVQLPPVMATNDSPMPPTSSLGLNSAPCTPGSVAEEDVARRFKMAAKLSRTLGENIPPELVLPSAEYVTRRRPRRASSITAFDGRIESRSRRTSSSKAASLNFTVRDEATEGPSLVGSLIESVRSSTETETCLISRDKEGQASEY